MIMLLEFLSAAGRNTEWSTSYLKWVKTKGEESEYSGYVSEGLRDYGAGREDDN